MLEVSRTEGMLPSTDTRQAAQELQRQPLPQPHEGLPLPEEAIDLPHSQGLQLQCSPHSHTACCSPGMVPFAEHLEIKAENSESEYEIKTREGKTCQNFQDLMIRF